MASISEIRKALATNLGTIKGLRTYDYVPDSANVPFGFAEYQSTDFDTTFGRGLDTLSFTVTVVVGRVSDRVGQANLDGFASSSGKSSVKSAIESDKTLGGLISDCRVTGLTSYGQVTIGETTYLAAEFAVTVYSN